MKDSLKLLSLMAAEVGAGCQVQRVLALEKVSAYDNHQGETIAWQRQAPQPSPCLLVWSLQSLSSVYVLLHLMRLSTPCSRTSALQAWTKRPVRICFRRDLLDYTVSTLPSSRQTFQLH